MDEKQICEQYIKRVKTLLPYVGKAEKKYLDNLRLNVEDYCVNESIHSLLELENGFGKPEDIVHEYISSVETDELIQEFVWNLKRSKESQNHLEKRHLLHWKERTSAGWEMRER